MSSTDEVDTPFVVSQEREQFVQTVLYNSLGPSLRLPDRNDEMKSAVPTILDRAEIGLDLPQGKAIGEIHCQGYVDQIGNSGLHRSTHGAHEGQIVESVVDSVRSSVIDSR